MKKHDKENVSASFEEPRVATSTTTFILAGLDRVEWELERIDMTLEAEPDRVTMDDKKALNRSFEKIARECDILRRWLSTAAIEEPRN
jgi:hypothetical protein